MRPPWLSGKTPWRRFAMLLVGVALGIAATVLVAQQPDRARPAEQKAIKKILFLSGPKDHGDPGRHEYEKDLRGLAAALSSAPNLHGVKAEVYVGTAPRDPAVYADAAAIVIESSSDRDERETHPLFPPEQRTTNRTYDQPQLDFLKMLDARMKAGMGIALLHYANWAEHWVARRYYLDWTGGLWIQGGSRNPVDQWRMTPQNPQHPILRGVKEWNYRDEVFVRFFLPPDLKRTDLIVGTPARATIGPQLASWAYEREGGGRAFVMGGPDFHDTLSTADDFRRFLLNGIAWSAGIEVPPGGVESKGSIIP
jgi:type 1 glutamine amidotransferase